MSSPFNSWKLEVASYKRSHQLSVASLQQKTKAIHRRDAEERRERRERRKMNRRGAEEHSERRENKGVHHRDTEKDREKAKKS